jgi:hypothetical protein
LGKNEEVINTLGYEVSEDAYIDCQFNMNIPQNEKEIIENIVNATGAKVMSIDRAVEVNPYTIDVNAELERLKGKLKR